MFGGASLAVGLLSGSKALRSRRDRSIFGGTGGEGGGAAHSSPDSSDHPETSVNEGGAGGGGGGLVGSGGEGGDYINSQINIGEVHEHGSESDPSSMVEPSPIDENIDGSFVDSQIEKIRNQLELDEATVDFRMSSGNLFSASGFIRIFDIRSKSGKSAIRFSRNSRNELVFVHDDVDNGTGRVEVDIDGLESVDTFRIFLVWSSTKVRMHVGPDDVDSEVERELSEDEMHRI